jgi:hypothetical protein
MGLTSPPDPNAFYNTGDPNSWGYLAGQVAGAALPAGAAMKGLEAVSGGLSAGERVLASGGLAGATGVTTPVENIPPDSSFGQEKFEQIVSSVMWGLGLGAAGEKISEGAKWAVEKFWPLAKGTKDEQAVATVVDRMNRDAKYGGPTAAQTMQLLAASRGSMTALEKLGPAEIKKPLTIADVAMRKGTVRGLAGKMARSPGGKGRSVAFLNARDENEAVEQRIEGDIAHNIWAGLSTYKVGKYLNDARKAASNEAYEKLDSMTGIWSGRLDAFTKDPDIQKGLNVGFKLARREALARGTLFDPTMLGVDIPLDNPEGITITKTPNMRVLDMGKRGLDAMAREARRNGNLTEASSLEALNHSYVAEIDRLDKDGLYKAARKAYAGPSRALDLMEMGENIFKNKAEYNEDLASKLAPGEIEYVLAGIAEEMRTRLGSASLGVDANEAKRLLNTRTARKQLRAFLPNKKAADEFIDAVANEDLMAGAKGELIGGSQTAERFAEDENLGLLQHGARIFHHGVQHRPFITAAETLRFVHALRGKADPELEEAIAGIIFDPDIANSEMGKRIAAGIETTRSKTKPDFYRMLRGAGAAAAAGIANALPSTHPHLQRRDEE